MPNITPQGYNPRGTIQNRRVPASVRREVRARLESTALCRFELGVRRTTGGLMSGNGTILWTLDYAQWLIGGIANQGSGPGDQHPFPNGQGVFPNGISGIPLPGGLGRVDINYGTVVATAAVESGSVRQLRLAMPFWTGPNNIGGQPTLIFDYSIAAPGVSDYFFTNWRTQGRSRPKPSPFDPVTDPQQRPLPSWGSLTDKLIFAPGDPNFQAWPYWFDLGGSDAGRIIRTQVLDNVMPDCLCRDYSVLPFIQSALAQGSSPAQQAAIDLLAPIFNPA